MESQNSSTRWTKTFSDLLIWQKAIDLVTKIYTVSAQFPRYELLGIVSQLRRASVSIPSNIAEGYGRKSPMDFVRFCQIAMGSLFEVQTQLTISRNLGYLHDNDFDCIYEATKEIERMLSSFIERLRTKQQCNKEEMLGQRRERK